MTEIFETPQEHIEPEHQIRPESGELLDVLKKEGLAREKKPNFLSEDGITADAAKMFDQAREINKLDSESGHTPQLNEEQKRQVINKLLKPTDEAIASANMDPDDAIKMLSKISPDSNN